MIEPSTAKTPSRWPGIIALGLLVVAGGGYWAATSAHESKQNADQLRLELASMQGHRTCRLATLKAAKAMVLGGRNMTIYAPDQISAGPPPVVSCGMTDNDGQIAAPVRVKVLCDRADLRCVELV